MITGSGKHLLDQAAAAGLEVIIEPALRTPSNHAMICGRCAHSAPCQAGLTWSIRTPLRRAPSDASPPAAPRCRESSIRITASRSTSFSPRPSRRDVAIERRLGRITDVALRVGTGVAVRRSGGAWWPGTGCGPSASRYSAAAAGLPGGAGNQEPRAPRVGLPADATVVGAVGRLTYPEGAEDFLAAMRKLAGQGLSASGR